jgi:hypothetical protein
MQQAFLTNRNNLDRSMKTRPELRIKSSHSWKICHKPVGLLICQISQVPNKFHKPLASDLWLNSQTVLTIILSVKIPFQCSKVYRLHDQKNQDNSFNFRFQIGNDGQSKRLLVNLGRNLLFHYYFILFLFDKNRNTGFSSRHLLRLQQFCMNTRFRNGSFWIQWYTLAIDKLVYILLLY